MKLASLLMGGIAALGLLIAVGCEADVDTASSQPPSNVTIENRYEDRDPDVRYGTPERDQNIRIETSEQNDFDIEPDDPDDRDWEIEADGDSEVEYESETNLEVDD